LLPVALILVTAKLISLLLGKIHIPQVIGFLVAGLLIGALSLIPDNPILSDYVMNGIDVLAKIGVVLILFSAGVETNLKQIKAVGFSSVVITGLGVIVPMGLGFLVAFLFRVYGGMDASFYSALSSDGVSPIYSDLYYGVILSATSVSITVAVLKELGKLDSRFGNAIVAAAILDDIIGVILLSLIISLSGKSSGSGDFNVLKWIIESCDGTVEGGIEVVVIILNMAIFFGLSIGVGYLVRWIFNRLGTKYPHHIRIPMLAFAFCFFWAYLAQWGFQIADITGAYIAGLILSDTNTKDYIDRRVEMTANLLFVPIFFASVAMKMYSASLDFSDVMFLYFGIVWIFAGLIGKFVGAGSGALMCRFGVRESSIIGIGMMARAEVLIVTAQTGVEAGLVNGSIIPYTLCLILISSFITPLLLKAIVKPSAPVPPSRSANVLEAGAPSGSAEPSSGAQETPSAPQQTIDNKG
jgi:Kef-type K+ transport system membrane component KefB